jgi:hypothetical protein
LYFAAILQLKEVLISNHVSQINRMVGGRRIRVEEWVQTYTFYLNLSFFGWGSLNLLGTPFAFEGMELTEGLSEHSHGDKLCTVSINALLTFTRLCSNRPVHQREM